MSDQALQLVEEEQPLQPLLPHHISQAHHVQQHFVATVPANLKPENLLDPKLWVNKAQWVHIGAKIDCLADDMSWYAELIAIGLVGGNQLIVRQLRFVQLEGDMPDVPEEEYFVEQRQGDGWCVIDRASGEAVEKRCGSRAKAYSKLEELLKILAT